MLNLFFPDKSSMKLAAQALGGVLSPGVRLYFDGELGSGKTTFTQGILRGLGYTGTVKSPTYTIVESYDILGREVYHFDFYRIRSEEELEHAGIREYFRPTTLCIVEWASLVPTWLPPPDLQAAFTLLPEGRLVSFQARSPEGERILHRAWPG